MFSEWRIRNTIWRPLQNVLQARLAQSAERKALNLVVVGSSPTVGALFLQQVDMVFAIQIHFLYCKHAAHELRLLLAIGSQAGGLARNTAVDVSIGIRSCKPQSAVNCPTLWEHTAGSQPSTASRHGTMQWFAKLKKAKLFGDTYHSFVSHSWDTGWDDLLPSKWLQPCRRHWYWDIGSSYGAAAVNKPYSCSEVEFLQSCMQSTSLSWELDAPIPPSKLYRRISRPTVQSFHKNNQIISNSMNQCKLRGLSQCVSLRISRPIVWCVSRCLVSLRKDLPIGHLTRSMSF